MATCAELQTGLTVDGARDVSGDVVTRPYLRVANVQAGRLDLEHVADISVPRAIAARSRLQAGDVLMTEGGDLDKLGRGTVWHGEIQTAFIRTTSLPSGQTPRNLMAIIWRFLRNHCTADATSRAQA